MRQIHRKYRYYDYQLKAPPTDSYLAPRVAIFLSQSILFRAVFLFLFGIINAETHLQKINFIYRIAYWIIRELLLLNFQTLSQGQKIKVILVFRKKIVWS